MAYITLDARRCKTRNAPISLFGGARVGGVHKLWLRSRTDSSRYARKNAANLTLKHNIIFILAALLFCLSFSHVHSAVCSLTSIIHAQSRKKSLALCWIAVHSLFFVLYVRMHNLNKLITADEIYLFGWSRMIVAVDNQPMLLATHVLRCVGNQFHCAW